MASSTGILPRLKFGAGCFLQGQRSVWRHKELLRLFLVPLLIGGVFFLGAAVAFFFYVDDFLSLFWARPESWFLQILWYVYFILAAGASFLTLAFSSYLVFMVAAAPFNDLISETLEGIEGTWEVRPFSWGFLVKDLWQSIAVELAKVGRKLLWVVPLYILSLVVPVLGPVLYFTLGTYKVSFMLGVDYVDWALARRGYSWRDRLAFAEAHRLEMVGFGLAFMLVGLAPLGFLLAWPGSVAGGTLLCTGLAPEDRRQD